MTIDPRTPVLVGAGQVDGRELDAGGEGHAEGDAPEPVEMMAQAAREALDGGARDLLSKIDSVRVVSLLSWRYRDPGRLVASLLGADPGRTGLTGVGGQQPQEAVAAAAADIAAGRSEIVLVTGGESWRTRMRWRAQDRRPPWTRQDDDVAPTESGVDVPLSSPEEKELGLYMPVQLYPLFEQALRLDAGRSVDEQLDHAAGLWARFSEVAADNPHAWTRVQRRPDEIRTPGPDNRWVGWPYPKLLNSNNNVDQAASLILCSAGAAQAAGVPRDRWVFPHSSVSAHDTLAVTNRPALHRSPAIRVAARRALDLAGTDVDGLSMFDLYSCFPSAVQVAAAEAGIPLDDPARPPTVTGGLTFAGGPWNNYVSHAIATTAERLREADSGALALVTANGGFLTKHALGVYGSRPPAEGFRTEDVQKEVEDAEEPTPAAYDHVGPATVEAWTVMHGRDGRPEQAFVAVRTADEARSWATSTDRDVLTQLLSEDVGGRPVAVGPEHDLRLSD